MAREVGSHWTLPGCPEDLRFPEEHEGMAGTVISFILHTCYDLIYIILWNKFLSESTVDNVVRIKEESM